MTNLALLRLHAARVLMSELKMKVAEMKNTGRAAQRSFVIEREVPGAGRLSHEELVTLSKKSCRVLDELGPCLQWIHSYVTTDKIYCIYSAIDEDPIRRHGELGGFPTNRISEISTVIDPSTAAE